MMEVPVVDAVGVALALLARFGVVEPWDIDVELFAEDVGAIVLYRTGATADARVVRRDGRSFFAVSGDARGTPRARFSIAHELGHHLLHRHVDGIDRIHGRPSQREEFPVERQADKFAVELQMPAHLFAPYCGQAAPVLDDVRVPARAFGTSLTATGRRFAKLSPAACAFVESRAGVITRVTRSAKFRASIARGHAVPEPTLAAALARRVEKDGARDPIAGAWGAAQRRLVREESFRARGTDRVVTWLVQARA